MTNIHSQPVSTQERPGLLRVNAKRARSLSKEEARKSTARRGGRATENGRRVKVPHGITHRIYKMKDPSSPPDSPTWIRWDERSQKERHTDTILHRFHREVGFSVAANEEERQDIEGSECMKVNSVCCSFVMFESDLTFDMP
jgi:hypothetical protein